MSLLARLLARFRPRPATPLASFHTLFDPAAQPNFVTVALESAPLDPEARAEALATWATIAPTQATQPEGARALIPHLPPAAILAVTRAARLHLPDQPWPHIQGVLANLALNDRPAAQAALMRAETHFAANMDRAQAWLEALLEAGRQNDAARFFKHLSPGWRETEWGQLVGLKLARHNHDNEAALLHAAGLRIAAPDNPTGYLAACQILRATGRQTEAAAIADEGVANCPDDPLLLQEAALLAEATGRFDLAHDRWARARQADPNDPATYVGQAGLAVRRQQPEIAKNLLVQGLQRFPTNTALLQAAANQAVRNQHWPEVAAYWETLLAQSPNDPALALSAATAMIGPRLGRAQRLPAVLRQLDAHHARFPDFVPAYTAHINALREVKWLKKAATHADDWRLRFPAHQGLAIACARVAEDQGRHTDAVATLAAVRGTAPPNPAMENACIRALSLAGQEDAAEQACDAALAAFPENHQIIEQHVALATRRGDFTAAAARAAQQAQQYPRNDAIARLAKRMHTLRDDEAANAPPPVPAAPSGADANFFLKFESLGGTSAGCEFGLVQRQFGAEPLGLLRWGNMRTEGLIRALGERFAGMGNPDTTRVVVQRASADHQEYFILDDHYGYWTHTFIKVDDAPADRVLKQTLRRLGFLRGKLIEDLELAEKIIVFKITKDEGPDICRSLHAALRAYGPCTLLCMTTEDAEHPKGTLDMPQPGLFIGRASMFMDYGSGSERGIDADNWRSLCDRVAAWHAKKGQGSDLD